MVSIVLIHHSAHYFKYVKKNAVLVSEPTIAKLDLRLITCLVYLVAQKPLKGRCSRAAYVISAIHYESLNEL